MLTTENQRIKNVKQFCMHMIKPLKQVKKFSYLGDIPSETASFEETMKARAAKAIGIST